nr:hypothetical protein [Kofleriaceae bacterium]
MMLSASLAFADGGNSGAPPPATAPQGPPPAADAGSGSPTTSGDTTSSAITAPEPVAPEEAVEYGIGIRLRSVYVPQSILELFVDRAAGGAQNYGYGVDIVRRRGNTELQLGIEFEHVQPPEGVYINKGDVVPQNSIDYILSPQESGHDLGWFTIDFTFFHHAEINKYVSFRYGAGLGLGIITGELDHFNVVCAGGSTNQNVNPGCFPTQFHGTGTDEDGHNFQQQVKYDLPPVFPVVNGIIGFQFKPTDKFTINVEGGIRSLPFLGLEMGYFF